MQIPSWIQVVSSFWSAIVIRFEAEKRDWNAIPGGFVEAKGNVYRDLFVELWFARVIEFRVSKGINVHFWQRRKIFSPPPELNPH